MSTSAAGKFINTKSGGYVVLIGAAVGAAYLIYNLLKKAGKDVKDEVGQAISGASEVIGGIATGRNAVTAGTVYEGAGVFGTLGAGANAASGGGLEAIGEWAGGKIYDWFGDDDSASIQSTTGNPYSPTGPTANYRQAANNSPVNAQYAASPLIQPDVYW